MKNSKLSSFLHIHHFNDNIILYNALNLNMIVIKKEHYELLEKYRNSIDELFTIKPAFFSMLRKLDYIIDADLEEMDKVVTKYNSTIFNSSSYRLTILPTLDCNFKCWYCYEKRRDKELMSAEMMDRIKNFTSNTIQNSGIKHLTLDWFGGEPMMGFEKVMYPLSKEIIEQCKSNNITFSNSITTNGYLIQKEWLPLINEIKLNNYQITLDGDEEAHNKVKKSRDAYSKTIENINLLCENIDGIHILLRFNYTDDKLDTIKSVIDYIPKQNRQYITLSLQKVWQYKDITQNHDEKKAEIYKCFKLEGFKIDEYVPDCAETCYADRKEQAVINYDGLVFKCTARDYVFENSDGVLNEVGTIEWDEKKLYKRLARKQFYYAKCQTCNLLPLCLGPCSQKVLETPVEDFPQICNYLGLEISINEYLEKRYNNLNIKL